ncbi:hypothetical protein JCM10207_006772 [Rhodosporidiobolus poonsookiae]
MPKITVSYTPGQLDLVVQFPVAFLVESNLNSNRFLAHLAQQLVDEPGVLYRTDALNQELDPEAVPAVTDYHFFPKDSITHVFTETRGPEGRRSRFHPAPYDGNGAGSDTDSHSSSESPEESDFRMALYRRDGVCCFTRSEDANPVHLVPLSRHDVLEDITGEVNPFDPSAGLLLDAQLRTSYENYDWSLFLEARLSLSAILHETDLPLEQDGKYFFVCFNAMKKVPRACHGKHFSTADCRTPHYPDPKLCAWHFRQCVLKNIRGYSVRMAINAE